MRGRIVSRNDILRIVKNKKSPTPGSRIAGLGGMLVSSFPSKKEKIILKQMPKKPYAKAVNHHVHIPMPLRIRLKNVA
jgi:hypothetical protein